MRDALNWSDGIVEDWSAGMLGERWGLISMEFVFFDRIYRIDKIFVLKKSVKGVF
jgi:hypothetical protein